MRNLWVMSFNWRIQTANLVFPVQPSKLLSQDCYEAVLHIRFGVTFFRDW